MGRKYSIIILSLLLILGSCVTNKKIEYMQDPGNGISEYEKMVTPDDYKVQVLDELNIRISTLDPEMTSLFNMVSGEAKTAGVNSMPITGSSNETGYNSYTINEDSCILFPYIGKIKVLGKTTREIKKVISDTLSSFLKDYSVDVQLMNSYFSIIGDATNGRYPLTKERMNLFQALSLIGDIGDLSDRAHIKMIRQTPEGTVVKEFDLRSKDIVDSEFYYIQPNDVIYIQSFHGQFFEVHSFASLFSLISTAVSLSYIIVRFNKIF